MENANLKKTKSTNSLWICTVILLTASIFSSCSKSETDNNPTGNTTKLIINIDGINDPKSEIKTKASINATSAN